MVGKMLGESSLRPWNCLVFDGFSLKIWGQALNISHGLVNIIFQLRWPYVAIISHPPFFFFGNPYGGADQDDQGEKLRGEASKQ